MRLITMLLFCCLCTFAVSQNGWIDQTPSNDLPGIFGIFTLDGNDIWAVGEAGTILHSLDGGESWTSIGGVTDQTVYSVAFINADTGWIGCDNNWNDAFLFRTTDGGVTWENQADVLYSPFDGQPVMDIEFVERPGMGSMRGYCAGGLSFAWISDDYGETWESINGSCGSGSFESCCIVDENTGWFVGFASTINPATVTRMDDAGGSWTPQTNPTDQPLRGVCFANDQHGVAVGNVGTIINTADGGSSWVSRPNEGYRWQETFLRASGKAWAVGSEGSIGHSSDWGDTWEMQESGTDRELWDVFFINDSEGWAVGGGIGQAGVILHTTTGGLLGAGEHNAGHFILEQNKPNPFWNSTEITYVVGRPAHIHLSVFNILGQEIAILNDEFKVAGAYNAVFEPQSDFSGIYYCELQVDGRSLVTRKMVLVR